jgi:protein FAM126
VCEQRFKVHFFQLLHPICIQLYNFYRSNENELKCFTLQFIPNLIYLYLNAVATGDKQNFRSVETLILCAYNIEVCSEKGLLKSTSYRMPVLAQASIYHEEKNLHASDLKRWEDHSNKDISWRSMSQVYKITAQNRMSVAAALMFVFNQQLSQIQKSSLYHLCKNSSKIVTQGFSKPGHSYRASYGSDPLNTSTSSTSSAPKQSPRIPLGQLFLIELLHAIYFAMFNEFASVAIQAVDDIHSRACYELHHDVILVTNAIKNSLQANPSGELNVQRISPRFLWSIYETGQPSDGPMGISVALTPATTVVTVSKSMITNASFRTKKLPGELRIFVYARFSTFSDLFVCLCLWLASWT